MAFVVFQIMLFTSVSVYLNTVFGQTCTTSEDCDLCGVCIDKTATETECYYPYPRAEVRDGVCQYKRDLCKEYPCDHGGVCRVEYGFSGPSCDCAYEKRFMGQHCDVRWDEANIQHSGLDTWVQGFTVLVDQVRRTSKVVEVFSIDFHVPTYSQAKDLQFYVETSEGLVMRFNSFTDCPTSEGLKCMKFLPSCKECNSVKMYCELIYEANVRFPYKVIPGPGVITRSGEVIGYTANITLVANTWNMGKYLEVYRNVIPVMVNYEDLRPDQRDHMPAIELQNCGSSLEQRLIFPRRSDISINSKVKIAPYDMDLPVWTTWDVYKFRKNYQISDKVVIRTYSLTFGPFALEVNIYRIELKVTVRYEREEMSNYAECYIEVIKHAVVAFISGGSARTVNRNHPVTISGEDSYSPDERKCDRVLEYFWSCSPQCDDVIPEGSVSLAKLTVPRDVLEHGKTYNFTLKVSAHGLEDDWAFQEVHAADEDVSVYCLMNCLSSVVPSDPLLLEVRLPSNGQLQRTFVWTIDDESGTKVDTDAVKCKPDTYPSHLLCVERNALKFGESYYVRVQHTGSTATAALRLGVAQAPKLSCFVTPTKGVQAVTPFTVSCSKPAGRSSWVFEFFDKRDSDVDDTFSGRMINTNNLGVLRDFKMCRGNIHVYLFDTNGVVFQWKQTVELELYNATGEKIDELFTGMENMIEDSKMELALKTGSIITELVGLGSDKPYIAKRMAHLLGKIPFGSQHIRKLALMTIKNFIISLTTDGDFKINPGMMKSLAQLVHTSTHWTDFAMDLADTAVPSISYRMLQQMASASVEAIERLLAGRNESSFQTSLEDLNISDYEDGLEASIAVDDALRLLSRVLSFKQATGYSQTAITSSTNGSVVTAQSDYLELIAKRINEDKHCPLKMSEKAIKDLSHVKVLTVQITTLRHNPFWASTTVRDISTNLLSLELYSKHSLDSNMTRVNDIQHEIDLFLEVLHSEARSVEIMVTQLDPTTTVTEDLDTLVTVLRLDLSSHSKLFFSFSFQRGGDEIKISVSDSLRPDYMSVYGSSTIVSSSNTSSERSVDIGDGDSFVYIGILPGPKVPVNGTVNVTVHFHYQRCLTWLRHHWVPQYCRVGTGTNTNRSIVHCSCTHLSFFGAIFAVPPNEVDPFNSIELFLTVKDNWLIVVFVACLLLAFFLFGVWAKCNDARDQIQRTVLVLEDNFPGDKYYYLLAVFTDCRLNAGTDAHVGVRIDGSESSSRSHILKSDARRVLQRNSEDWFFIQTPLSLGVVTKIHVWRDNAGVSPDWFCNKMVVYDLQTSVVYTFFVEQWLAFESDEFCEAVLLPATTEDIYSVKRIILDNIAFGFREADLSGSILARHPRSRIDRLERVMVLMCFIMLAVFFSLAFYKVNVDDAYEGFDDFGYSFQSEDIIITFQTFVISWLFLFLISVAFRKAYKPRNEPRGHGDANLIYTRPAQQNPLLETPPTEPNPPLLMRNLDEHSCYHRLVRKMRRNFHPLPLSPVVMSRASAHVERRRVLYAIAWLLSVSVITFCGFFTVLYGLKLGQEESKRWFTAMSLVLAEEFLVMSPLKIVIIGLTLAMAFQRFAQISSYNVAVEEFLKERPAQEELFYTSLLHSRAHQMYQPLRKIEREKLRVQQKMHNIKHNLIDLLIVIGYIVTICLVTDEFSTEVESYANSHISKMVHNKHKSTEISFMNIRNRTEYYEYLDYTFITALYETKWYNRETDLNPPVLRGHRWWTLDYTMRLVGPPVCRQLRVDPKECSLNRLAERMSLKCIPDWGPGMEDDDDYMYGWQLATKYEASGRSRESSAWTYVRPSETDRLTRQGDSWTSYHGGGYMATFSRDRFETERIVQILTESEWIDEYTRVVFLDFTLFNVNENMFTEVVLIAEHFPFDLYVTRTMIDSVQLPMVHNVWKVGLVLFALITLFHVIRMFRLMNRKGLLKYFSEFVNIYQLLINSVGLLSITCFLVHLKVSLDYTEMFQRRGLEVFFEFDKIVYYYTISKISLAVLFCCLSFRLFSLWPFGGSSLNIYHTLLFSGKSLAHFLVLFVVNVFIYCRLVSYLLNHTLSLTALYWQWVRSDHCCSTVADLVVQFTLTFLIKLCLLYFLMLFCYQYKMGKSKKVSQSDLVVFWKWITRTR